MRLFLQPIGLVFGSGRLVLTTNGPLKKAVEILQSRSDRTGLSIFDVDMIYLQAKRWEAAVDRPEIQRFVGALHGTRARKGVFLTTGSFSSEARDYVAHIEPKVVLIDGRQLTELMIDFEVGVTTVANYQVRKIDSDYFGEE